MADLRERFATFDAIPMPDLWPVIQDQAAALLTGPTAERVAADGPRRARDAAGLRPVLVWLVVLGLIAAALVGIFVAGRFQFSPPAVVSPSPATEPSADASAALAVCPAVPTPNEAQLTPVMLPNSVVDLVFAHCSVWAQSESNNGGIARIDPLDGAVVTTIVPDEIVASITVHDGAVFAIAHPANIGPGVTPRVVRVDPATNVAVDVVAVPISGQLAILGDMAWVRHARTGVIVTVPLDGSAPPIEAAATRPFIGPAFGAIWTQPSQGSPLGRIDGTGRSTSIEVGDAPYCAIARTGVVCASDSGHVAFVSAETNTVAWSTDLPGWRGDVVSVAASDQSIWIQPAEIQPGRLDAIALIELDTATGREVRRLELPVRQPIDLWALGGSLWISSAEEPLTRLNVPSP